VTQELEEPDPDGMGEGLEELRLEALEIRGHDSTIY
jgi:hypothetical protein